MPGLVLTALNTNPGGQGVYSRAHQHSATVVSPHAFSSIIQVQFPPVTAEHFPIKDDGDR